MEDMLSSSPHEALAYSVLINPEDPSRLTKDEIESSYGNCFNFFCSFGLKPWENDDCQEALSISRSFKADMEEAQGNESEIEIDDDQNTSNHHHHHHQHQTSNTSSGSGQNTPNNENQSDEDDNDWDFENLPPEEGLARSQLVYSNDNNLLTLKDIKSAYGSCLNFFLSFGLKPWINEDVNEAKAISRAMKQDIENEKLYEDNDIYISPIQSQKINQPMLTDSLSRSRDEIEKETNEGNDDDDDEDDIYDPNNESDYENQEEYSDDNDADKEEEEEEEEEEIDELLELTPEESLARSQLINSDNSHLLTLKEIQQSYGSCLNFFLTFGLRPWESSDCEEALSISKSLKSEQ